MIQDGLRPQARERRAARLLRRAVDDQDPVEVVELVLGDARGEALELERELLAVDSLALETHGGRALDRGEHAREREAALLVDLALVALRDDDRVHNRERV